MQRTALTLAVAAALSAFAGSASAYSFSDGGYTQSNTIVIRISGSSATNNQTKTWLATKFCTNAAKTTGIINKTSDSNNFGIVCQPTLGGPFSKPNVAIVKNSTGGSGNGVTQLKTGTLGYLDVFQSNPAAVPLTVPGPPPNDFKADLGVTDEEPDILLKAGAIAEAGVPFEPLNVVTFGTPVTLGLYRALQTAQLGTTCTDDTTTSGVIGLNDNSEACMPSLSQSQIASIFGGQLVNWNEIGLASKPVYIARRVITSGTQTAARMFFLNDPCADNMLGFVAGDPLGVSPTKADACNEVAPNLVFEGSGSGNVSACLTNHERNSRWAIGVNSLELPNLTDSTPAYSINGGAAIPGQTVLNKTTQRHIKIDGFAPTTFNVATGRYKFWYEAAITSRSPNNDAIALKAAMTATQDGFNDPTVLVPLNASFNTTVLLGAGKSAGILSPALTSTPPSPTSATGFATETNTTAKPEMYYTRAISGTANSCQPAMSLWATGINP